MKLVIISLLAITLCASESVEPTPGSVVDVARFISYKRAEELAKNGTRFFLVLFTEKYQPCLQFLDILENVNDELNKIDTSLSMYALRLDSPENEGATSQWRIVALPTIYLFMGNSEPILYEWERTPELIVKFYKMISNIVVAKIETTGDLKKLKKSARTAILFVVEEEPNENHVVYRVARHGYEAAAGYTMKGSNVGKQYKKWINVFRNGELKTMDPPERNSSELEKFIKVQTHQDVFFFPEDTTALPGLFEDKFLFYLDNFAGITKATPWLEKLGDEGRGDYVVLICNNANSDIDRTLKYFGVKKGDPPRVRLTIRSKDYHYRLEQNISGPVSEDKIKTWLKRYEENGLKPFVKSQPVPEDWYKRPVKILVGANYELAVNDMLKHVFVLLYAPGGRDSDYALARFEELAEICNQFDDVIIAKIDVNSNDIPHYYLRIGKIPAARFYPKGEKKEVEYTGSPLLNDMKKFIEEQTGYIIADATEKAKAGKSREARTGKTQEAETEAEKTQEAEAKKARAHEEF